MKTTKKNLSRRFRKWQSKQIDLLSFSINIFFVISITFYGFFLDNKELFCHKTIPFLFDSSLKEFLAFVLPLNISLWIVLLLVRLNDFRITKNLVKTREKVNKLQHNSEIVDLNTKSLHLENLSNKIQIQKTITRILGRITWVLFYIQIFILIVIIWLVG